MFSRTITRKKTSLKLRAPRAFFDKIATERIHMTINNDIKKIKKQQGSSTGLAFIVGAILGGIFGSDLIIALVAGVVAALAVWWGYSDEIDRKEKERTLHE